MADDRGTNTVEDIVVAADTMEEGMAKAAEEFLKRHPNADPGSIRIISIQEEAKEN